MAVYPASAYVAANTEYLSRDSATALQAGDIPFTVVAWARVATLDSTYSRQVVAKWVIGGSKREYVLRASKASVDRFLWYVSPDGVTFTSVTANTFGAIPLDTWVLVVATHDPDADQIAISVNGGVPDVAAYATGVHVDVAMFETGAYNDAGEPMDGRIGPVGLARGYVLTNDDIAEIYNSGNGRLWAQLSSALQAKFGSAWWDMTETSGPRASWDGSLNLTDNHTVMSGDGPVVKPAGSHIYRAYQ